MTLKDQICDATDALRKVKIDAGQGNATYDGRVQTMINARAIASLIR
jgi:hypothetical protein